MKRRQFVVLIAVLTVAVSAMPLARRVWAQGAVEKRFDQLDKNRDGKITPDELPVVELFQRLDLDGNGEITRPEAAKALARGAVKELIKPKSAASAPTEPTPPEAPVRQGPQPVRPGDHGIGRFVPDASFTDLNDKKHTLSEFTREKIVVLAMTSTSCPLSKKYLPTLVELAKTSGDDVVWVLVNPVATDKVAEMQSAAGLFGDRVVYVHDADGRLAQTIGALTTTDVVVLDRSRTIVYHGAIDDQYGFGYSMDAPRYRYLADAMTAIKASKLPFVSATEAPGCTLEQPSSASGKADVTYHNRISRLFQQHCIECHRDGGVAPFPLDTYDDAVAHVGMIKQVVERGMMPPWFATATKSDPESGRVHTPWANDPSLAAIEKQDLFAWISAGKPEGDRNDAPVPSKFDEGWQIGPPDAIYQFARPVPIKATGVMPYQNIIVETNLSEDKWVQAIEVQPGNRGVVHHILVNVQGAGVDDAGELVSDAAAERTGFWGIYVPGNSQLVYPDGFAKRIPKGAKLKFQVHYTPNGTATTDQTRIGLIWAKQPPQHEVRVAGIVNARLSIPPGADNHREEAVLHLPVDATILGFLPHMHLRGKACKYEVTRTDGTTTTLLDIPRYDFNWQLLYRYMEPLTLKSGDALRFTAWYDNSDKNPANPDPTRTVRWGAQTFDEMHLGYVEYYIPSAKPSDSASLTGRRGAADDGRPGVDVRAIFKRLDRNNDGKLIRDEIPEAQRERLMRLDTNQDGAITLEEAKRFRP